MKLNNIYLMWLIFLSSCGIEPGTTYIAPQNNIQLVEFQDKKHTRMIIIFNHSPWDENGLEVVMEATIKNNKILIDSNAVYSTVSRGSKDYGRIITTTNKIVPNDYHISNNDPYGLNNYSETTWLKANLSQIKIIVK